MDKSPLTHGICQRKFGRVKQALNRTQQSLVAVITFTFGRQIRPIDI